jgi:hypothetical protein
LPGELAQAATSAGVKGRVVLVDCAEWFSFAYGALGLHDAAVAVDGAGREGLALNFVAEEPLEDVEQRLLAAGFPPEGRIVDHEWGRALQVGAPDGIVVQLDERDRGLYM